MAEQLTIEMLPAEYGDCLWVECCKGTEMHRILIDGGPPATAPLLRRRMEELSPPKFDLLVVSHLDADHIGGIVELLADGKLPATFADVWFNGFQHLPPPPESRDFAQAETLTMALTGNSGAGELPWNLAWERDAVVRSNDNPTTARSLEELPAIETDWGLRITLLSPTPRRLAALWRGWDAFIRAARAGESSQQTYQQRGRSLETAPDLETLAAVKSSRDNTPPNGSSIAFLLEYGGRSCLFAADAFATVLGPALATLAASRGVERLEIDAFKIPHHGSQANVLPQLFDLVRARHYLISTSGARFGHPHDEAMARIITLGGPGQTIWFNYATAHTTRWADKSLLSRYHYDVRIADPTGGITIAL
jgi:beta-lactamase superfamily II metal-dependent hydrolase